MLYFHVLYTLVLMKYQEKYFRAAQVVLILHMICHLKVLLFIFRFPVRFFRQVNIISTNIGQIILRVNIIYPEINRKNPFWDFFHQPEYYFPRSEYLFPRSEYIFPRCRDFFHQPEYCFHRSEYIFPRHWDFFVRHEKKVLPKTVIF